MTDKKPDDQPFEAHTGEVDPKLVHRIEQVLERYDSAGWTMPIDLIARDLAQTISAFAAASEPPKSA